MRGKWKTREKQDRVGVGREVKKKGGKDVEGKDILCNKMLEKGKVNNGSSSVRNGSIEEKDQ